MAREPTLLSIAAPMHDEEGTAAAFYERVVAAVGDVPFELVIADDGSRRRHGHGRWRRSPPPTSA